MPPWYTFDIPRLKRHDANVPEVCMDGSSECSGRTLLHQFGWELRARFGHEKTSHPFSNADDGAFLMAISAKTTDILRLVPGGVVYRQYLVLTSMEGRPQYTIESSLTPFLPTLIRPEVQSQLNRSVAVLLGRRWQEMIQWTTQVTISDSLRAAVVHYRCLHQGANPPLQWEKSSARPKVDAELARGGKVVLTATDVPDNIPFRACAKRAVERQIYDILEIPIRGITTAEA